MACMRLCFGVVESIAVNLDGILFSWFFTRPFTFSKLKG